MDNLWSMEAEQSVIGALLYDCNAWDAVSGILRPEYFVDDRHKTLFNTIKALADAAKPWDGLVIRDELNKRGFLVQAGTELYIGELIKSCPGVYSIVSHACTVRDRFNLRSIMQAVTRCQAIIGDAELPLAERAEKAASEILTAASSATDDVDLFTLKDGLGELYRKLEADHNRGEGLAGLSTGFPDLDKRMNGMKGGELIIVAARPGFGKTNLALNIAGHNAKHGKPVAFFSMEMSKMELSGRMAACMASMSYQAMSGMEWESFTGPLGRFVYDADKYTMLIDDRASQTVDRIRVGCKKAKRMMGGLSLVVVDYLQLIQGKGQSRYEQVTNISRELKILAKDLNVPVLCLAQLNRGPADARRPKASDLRDSGAIEQDADIVALIHRDDNADGTTGQYAELIFDKIRAGQRGFDPLVVDFAHCRFRPADREAFAMYNQERKQSEPKKGGFQG